MTLAELFSTEFLRLIILRGLIVGVLSSVCASILGVPLVLKKYSMIGDGLSHVGFFAVAVAACAGASASYSMEISIPIVIVAAVLILRISRGNSKLSGDAACAVISTGAVAVGTIMYNLNGGKSGDICSSLFGSSSIVTITDKDVIISSVLSALVIIWFILSYKTLFSVTLDENFSKAAGIRTGLFSNLLAVLTGITIVVGMKMMGAIMVSAMILFPALTAMRLTKNFRLTVILAAVISVICFTAGFFAACLLSLQTGAAVVTAELAVFIAVTAVTSLVTRIRTQRSVAA